MSSPSAPLEMKGTAFHSMLDAVAELDGENAKALVVGALADPLATMIASGALTRVGWYPMALYGLLHEAIQSALGGGDRRARDLGRRSTEIDTRGLLRYAIAITTPALLVRHAQRVFGSYVRGGRIDAVARGAEQYELVFSNMRDATPYLFPEWEGGIGLLLEVSGGKDVLVRRIPGVREDGTIVMMTSWRTR